MCMYALVSGVAAYMQVCTDICIIDLSVYVYVYIVCMYAYARC